MHPDKQRCPKCGLECIEVGERTVLHHVLESWRWRPTGGRHFFCDAPGCDVVYFGDDGTTILRDRLRTPIGQKDASSNAALCYCFGVTRRDYLKDPSTRDFVLAQTKAGQCSCETSNPSGRCCLGDFPKIANR